MIRKYKIPSLLYRIGETFLTNSIFEKVIPTYISNILKFSHHIFPEHIKTFQEPSVENLKFSEGSILEKAWQLRLNLRNKKSLP